MEVGEKGRGERCERGRARLVLEKMAARSIIQQLRKHGDPYSGCRHLPKSFASLSRQLEVPRSRVVAY